MPRLAELLRRFADRIDYAGAPKLTNWSFTFEYGEGIRFREDGKGCRVAYLGEEQYARAHDEADVTFEDWRRQRYCQHENMTDVVDGLGAVIRRHCADCGSNILYDMPGKAS